MTFLIWFLNLALIWKYSSVIGHFLPLEFIIGYYSFNGDMNFVLRKKLCYLYLSLSLSLSLSYFLFLSLSLFLSLWNVKLSGKLSLIIWAGFRPFLFIWFYISFFYLSNYLSDKKSLLCFFCWKNVLWHNILLL